MEIQVEGQKVSNFVSRQVFTVLGLNPTDVPVMISECAKAIDRMFDEKFSSDDRPDLTELYSCMKQADLWVLDYTEYTESFYRLNLPDSTYSNDTEVYADDVSVTILREDDKIISLDFTFD